MTDTTNLGLNRPAFGDTAWDVAINENADIIDALFHATTGNHDHNGTTGHGKKLGQANTHESPDTDAGPTSLHHTLGTGANQAAAGNHTHAASALVSGTVATARLGSGTADATTYLRGDQTWQTVSGGGGGGDLLAANNLSDLASATTARTNLGLAIGTDVEAHDADLTTIAGLTPSNDDVLQRKAGAWAHRTLAQLVTDLNAAGGLTGGATNPLTTLDNDDDFCGGLATTGNIGKLGWSFSAGLVSTAPSEAGHPGLIQRSTGTTSGTKAVFYLSPSQSDRPLLPAETFALTWIVRAAQVDAATLLRVGAGDSVTTLTNGIYLERLAADTNWYAVTRSGGVQTRTDTGVAQGTGWLVALIRRIDAATIGFRLGATVAAAQAATEITHTATIPTAVLMPLTWAENSAAAAKVLDHDYYRLQITGLTR